LKDFLVKKGYKVVLTKEPTLDSQAGKKIRKILNKKNQNFASQITGAFYSR